MNNFRSKWCDLKCRYARWPEEEALDGAKSCRTFVALYCGKSGRIVAKNAPCLFKKRSPLNEL